MKPFNHHHFAATAEIEFTTPFQYSLSVIAVKRSSLGMAVSLLIMSGKVSFRDRLCDDGCFQRTKDEMSSSEARAQWPANWTRLFRTRLDILHRCRSRMDGSSTIGSKLVGEGVYNIHPSGGVV